MRQDSKVIPIGIDLLMVLIWCCCCSSWSSGSGDFLERKCPKEGPDWFAVIMELPCGEFRFGDVEAGPKEWNNKSLEDPSEGLKGEFRGCLVVGSLLSGFSLFPSTIFIWVVQ